MKSWIENSIVGGFPFWLGYATPEGRLAVSLKPQTLKGLVENSDFEHQDSNKDIFKSFVQSLTNIDNDCNYDNRIIN